MKALRDSILSLWESLWAEEKTPLVIDTPRGEAWKWGPF